MTDATEDLPLGEWVQNDPGVWVQRRCFLRTTALALAGVGLPGTSLARMAGSSAPLTIEAFIEQAVPVARALLADTSMVGQDRYLLTLASLAVRLGDVPQPPLRPRNPESGPTTWIGSNGAPGPFVILHWKMDPGTEIEPHAHTYGNVVTLGLTGRALVENYEVVGRRDFQSRERIRVRRTVRQWLTPGATNLVNLERNYVHGFKVGSTGASGLDITTRIGPRGPVPYLRLAGQSADAPDVFDATWDLQ